jgi:hypothetical protein
MFVYAQILPTTTIGVVELFGYNAKKALQKLKLYD